MLIFEYQVTIKKKKIMKSSDSLQLYDSKLWFTFIEISNN